MALGDLRDHWLNHCLNGNSVASQRQLRTVEYFSLFSIFRRLRMLIWSKIIIQLIFVMKLYWFYIYEYIYFCKVSKPKKKKTTWKKIKEFSFKFIFIFSFKYFNLKLFNNLIYFLKLWNIIRLYNIHLLKEFIQSIFCFILQLYHFYLIILFVIIWWKNFFFLGRKLFFV